MDIDSVSADALASEMRASLRQGLRYQFPYMTSEALEALVEDNISNLISGICKLKPAMTAARSRTSFFSLPAEIRNEIYELALTPESIAQAEPKTVCIKHRPLKHVYYAFGMADSFSPEKKQPAPPPAIPTPALLHTSQQVRSECTSLHFSPQKFVAEFTPEDLEPSRAGWCCVVDWLQMLGTQQASKIEKMELRFYMCAWELGWCVRTLRRIHGVQRASDDIVEDEEGFDRLRIPKEDVLRAVGLTDMGSKRRLL